MAQNTGCVLLVHRPEDELANAVNAVLNRQEIWTLQITPDLLASRQLSLWDSCFYLDGTRVDGILFRVSPDSMFSSEFDISDQPFCDAELRAVLLAALNLDSLLAVNRYNARTWFEGLGWPTWRRALMRSGIPVADFVFGGDDSSISRRWYPYAGWQAQSVPGSSTQKILGVALAEEIPIQKSLMVGRDLIAGKRSSALMTAVELLADSGIALAEIVSDPDDRILTVNPLPMIHEPPIVDLASRRIAEMFHAHLDCR